MTTTHARISKELKRQARMNRLEELLLSSKRALRA